MGLFSWLAGGDDRGLAESSYAGRESASDRAARKQRAARQRSVAKAASAGERWEQQDRRKFGGRR
ncbi:hypothetical protein ACFVIL_29205 [Streptomyces sp. NPDC127159]|uniref:hypothetical protein n=1 Tax=unclassified Streptomyces TaxID=2593676 RepID=UPI0036405E63